ncbi:MAG: hypothetical protein ACPLN0_02660 [Candidatus Hydrothermia bacterium]
MFRVFKYLFTLILFLILTGCFLFKEERPVFQYNTPGYVHDLCISDTKLFVADGDSGVLVLDITDPEKPAIIARRTNVKASIITARDSLVLFADSIFWGILLLRGDTLLHITEIKGVTRDPIVSLILSSYFFSILTREELLIYKYHYPQDVALKKEILLYHSEAVDAYYDSVFTLYVAQRDDGIRKFIIFPVQEDSIRVDYEFDNFFASYSNINGIFPNKTSIELGGFFLALGSDGIKGYGISLIQGHDTLYQFNTRGYAFDGCTGYHHVYVADGQGVDVLKMFIDRKFEEVQYYKLPGTIKKIVALNDLERSKYYIYVPAGGNGFFILKQENALED